MKKLVSLVLALVLVLSFSTFAMAETWPNGTPTVYIGYGAGGGTDTAVRPIVAAMSDYLDETINCANMEGANSGVACDYVLSEAHDGYTLFATGTGGMSSFPVYGYTTSGWQDWVSFHAFSGPAVVYANVDSGITNVDELFAFLAEGNNFGIGAYGNGPHTQFESILSAKDLKSPNYSLFGSCGDAGVATIAGDVQVAASSLSAVIEYINAGRLVPLFVTSAQPFEFVDAGITTPSITTLVEGTENIPNLNETWPLLVPRDAPQEIIDALTEAFEHAITTDAVKEFAKSKGYTMIGLTGEEADKFLSFSISGYSWTIFNAGLADGNPADSGIPTLEEYDWEVVKETIK